MKSLNEIGYEENAYQNISSFLIMKYGLFPCIPIDFQVKIKFLIKPQTHTLTYFYLTILSNSFQLIKLRFILRITVNWSYSFKCLAI